MLSIANLKASLGRLAVAASVGSATILAFALSGGGLGEAASLNFAEPISPLSPVKTSTITGLGFGASFVADGSRKVVWNGADIDQMCPKLKVQPAACITKWTDKAITLLVPIDLSLGVADVQVVTGGNSVAQMDDGANSKYYYPTAPAILGKSARNGPLVGGTKVTLTGLHFGSSFVVDKSAVYGWPDAIVAMCQKTVPPGPVKGCVSKWTNTAVTIVTPDLTENGPGYFWPYIRTSNSTTEIPIFAYPGGSFGDGDPYFYQGAVVIKVTSLK